jgi:tRNA(fMet)-specific endonuclease VapC
MTTYLLDTCMCSFILRKDPAPSKRLMQLEPRHEIVLSAVVYFELRKGALAKSAPKKLNDAITEFVHRLASILPFGQNAAEHAARIHANLSANGQIIGLNDILIAGHASAAGCVLVTNNTGEFSRVRGLEIEDWSE